jgi:peptidoglycan hydrolase-like protein with peptidoglycan-binding domain
MTDLYLEAGAYGDGVSVVQRRLGLAGYQIPESEAGRRFFGPGTRAAVMHYQQDTGLPVTGRADAATVASLATFALQGGDDVTQAEAAMMPAQATPVSSAAGLPSQGAVFQGSASPAEYLVQGKVTWADGTPAVGILVRAVDQDLRREQPLGEATTDARGGYVIGYAAAQFARAEDETADLIVRVIDASGSVVTSSPIQFNAPLNATADQTISGAVAGQPSEYERIVAKVTPLLADLKPPALTGLQPSDLAFLAGETGIDRARMSALLTAIGLTRDAEAARSVVPTAAFYGVIRESTASSWAGLFLQQAAVISSALAEAARDGTIPPQLGTKAGEIAGDIMSVAAKQALTPQPVAGESTLSQLLSVGNLTSAQQETLVTATAAWTGSAEDFWTQLATQPGFETAGAVQKLQLILQLGLLTGNHAPLVQALLARDAVTSPADLVSMDAAQWTSLLGTTINGQAISTPAGVPGANAVQRTASYISGIMTTLQAAFPNETIANLVAVRSALVPDDDTRQAVIKFFANSPGLDIRTARISAYLADNTAAAFEGIPTALQPAVTNQVKRIQRAFQISVSADSMAALLSLDLDAAHLVADIPRQSFMDQFAMPLGGVDVAAAVYDRAQYFNSRSLLVLANLNDVVNGVATTATGNASNGNAPDQVQASLVMRLPDYAELFGSLDLCQCQECNSVVSPAAYLVNLLEYLRKSTPNAAGNTPLDVLIGKQDANGNTVLTGRRPDLSNIKLTCDNTNTELPYIDVVNEILESYVFHNYTATAAAAHDTGDATTAQLDASPQWTLTGSSGPYPTLAQQTFPFSLPYNQPIAVARTYLDHLRTSRYQLLSTFQVPPAGNQAAVDAEFLGMDPYLYQLLTGQSVTGAAAPASPPPYALYGYTAATAGWESHVGQVPVFEQRTGIAITDLTNLLSTHFANPRYPTGADAEFLDQIPLSYTDLLSLVTANFPASPAQSIANALTSAGMTVTDLQAWWERNSQIGDMIVIDTPDGCDLSNSRLVHLQDVGAPNPAPLTDTELGAMQAFIRLWHVVGWSMRDLDRAISALAAGSVTPALISGIARIRQLNQALNPPALQALFALYTDLDPYADDSLYAQLFENPTTVPSDSAFWPDDAYHPPQILPGTANISDHIPALLVALQVSASDLALIRGDAGLDDQPAPDPLTLDNVTTLYRYAALARALGLSISALISIKTLAGPTLNPFKTPAVPAATPDTTMAFVTLAQAVQNSPFSTAQLDYLYRHISAPPTGLAPDATTLELLAGTLRDALTQIATANAQAPDPSGSLTHAKLTQLVSKAAADQTVAMVSGTASYTTPLDPADLPASVTATNSSDQVTGINPASLPADVTMKLSYDPVAQALSYTGAMTTAELTELSAIAGAAAGFQAALQALAQQPATVISNNLNGPAGILSTAQAAAFLQTLRTTPAVDGQLKPVYLDQQGNPVGPQNANPPVTTVAAANFSALLSVLLPYLISQLSHTLIKQTIADSFSLSAQVTSLLLEQVLRSVPTPQNPVIADLLALATPGLSASFTPQAGPATSQTVAAVDFDGSQDSIPAGTTAVSFSAVLEPPATALVTFSVQTNGNPQLTIAGTAVELSPQPDGSYTSAPQSLTARQLIPVTLQIAALPAAAPTAVLSWQSATLPLSVIPGSRLIPQDIFDSFQQAYVRIQKAGIITGQFGLTAPETSYLTTANGGSFEGFDFNALPLSASVLTAPQSVQLFAFWPHLNAYIALRNGLPGGGGQTTMVDVFTAPDPASAATLLPQAAGWDPLIVSGLFTVFGLTAGPGNPITDDTWLTTLQACITLAQNIGADVSDLAAWSMADASFTDLDNAAQAIKLAARSHYDPVTWLDVAEPLSDVVRGSQRDALVASIMAQEGYTDPDSVYEQLLVDPEMSTCMPTSRIALAISSVQLFVQRCLLSLEQRDDVPAISVSPSAIDRQSWATIGQYSIWGAAMETFLWPETYLIPSLRDDKTPMFEDFESQLQQNSLTAGSIQAAYLSYLESLHEIDRLDIRTVYWQDVDPDTGEPVDILHVVGRTFHKPNKYFYRQLLNGTSWTPWEPLQVDIAGDHLLAVVWQRRLRLLWPIFTPATVTTQSVQASNNMTVSPPETYWQITLAWSEYSQGAWLPKQVTDDFVMSMNFAATAGQQPAANHTFRAFLDGSGALVVQVYPAINFSFSPVPSQPDAAPGLPVILGQFAFCPSGDGVGISYSGLQNGWPSGIDMYPTQPGDIIPLEVLYVPTGTGPYNDGYRETGGDATGPVFGSVRLPSTVTTPTSDPIADIQALSNAEVPYLAATPTAFDLRYTAQYDQFEMQAPFFYQDKNATFFVSPSQIHPIENLSNANTIDAKSLVKSAIASTETNRQPGAAAAVGKLETTRSSWGAVTAQRTSNWLPAMQMIPINQNVSTELTFATHQHPYVEELIKTLYRPQVPGDTTGVASLLSLTSQALGNPYLETPWTRMSWKAGSGALTTAWQAQAGQQASPASMVQAAFGVGPVTDFEAVILQGNDLIHYHLDNSGTNAPWQAGETISQTATGPGAIARDVGNSVLHVLVQQGGDLMHYKGAATQAAGASRPTFSWTAQPAELVASGVTGPSPLLANFAKQNGQILPLACLVLQGTSLVHYERRPQGWHELSTVTTNAAGAASLADTPGTYYPLHAVVPEQAAGAAGPPWVLKHYVFDGATWQLADTVSANAYGPGCIISSTISAGPTGNLDVVVPEDQGLLHYWFDTGQGGPWQVGQLISNTAAGAGCIVQSSLLPANAPAGSAGDFEVLVPEYDTSQVPPAAVSIADYRHANSDVAASQNGHYEWSADYVPQPNVLAPYPVQDIDFSVGAPYAVHNWELFFHIPHMIATNLCQDLQFELADAYVRLILDMTNDSPQETAPGRYWNFLPFKTAPVQTMTQLMDLLDAGDPQAKAQVTAWSQNPFEPYALARLRPSAFMKSLFMLWANIHISWGTYLFQAYTTESINLAELHFVMVRDALGALPETVPSPGATPARTYAELIAQGSLDAFGNLSEMIENEFPDATAVAAGTGGSSGLLGASKVFYFCLPQNSTLLGLWSVVETQLSNIRNCRNAQGAQSQPPPLFQPIANPLLLVEAAAEGVDLSSVLAALNAPPPNYRFSYLLERTLQLCAECRAFGSELLSALEKQDSEHLAALRASQEVAVQNLIHQMKVDAVSEASEAVLSLTASQQAAADRYSLYQLLLTGATPPTPDGSSDLAFASVPQPPTAGTGVVPLIPQEQSELNSAHSARDWHVRASTTETLASLMHYIPSFEIAGTPLGVGGAITFGGDNIGPALAAIARYQANLAQQDEYDMTTSTRNATYIRRAQEWTIQSNQAAGEYNRIRRDILAAQFRVTVAQDDQKVNEQQITDAQAIADFLTSKFTSEQLYVWHAGQLAGLYSQLYQLTFTRAQQLERCYQVELAVPASNYIQFGYWDSLRKGLLAGERLELALRQLEQAYMDQNKRELEITRYVSLQLHDPIALIALKETGQCIVDLPEQLFDLDYPGHYLRRIRNVSLTIPCVAGPYTNINCTLTLLSSKVRWDPGSGPGYPEQVNNDPRFIYNFGATQAIATSHAQNDSGMFEVNFRDERYLPFETAGVISRWQITLPRECNAFDINSITDPVIKLSYTARDGGDLLRSLALAAAKLPPSPQQTGGTAITAPGQTDRTRLFSIRHEFPTQWYGLLHPADTTAQYSHMPMLLTIDRFPFQYRGDKITTGDIQVFVVPKDLPDDEGTLPNTLSVYLTPQAAPPPGTDPTPPQDPPTGQVNMAQDIFNVNHGTLPSQSPTPVPEVWWLSIDMTQYGPITQLIDDILVVFQYTATPQ